jgi:hypothetical protein
MLQGHIKWRRYNSTHSLLWKWVLMIGQFHAPVPLPFGKQLWLSFEHKYGWNLRVRLNVLEREKSFIQSGNQRTAPQPSGLQSSRYTEYDNQAVSHFLIEIKM